MNRLYGGFFEGLPAGDLFSGAIVYYHIIRIKTGRYHLWVGHITDARGAGVRTRQGSYTDMTDCRMANKKSRRRYAPATLLILFIAVSAF